MERDQCCQSMEVEVLLGMSGTACARYKATSANFRCTLPGSWIGRLSTICSISIFVGSDSGRVVILHKIQRIRMPNVTARWCRRIFPKGLCFLTVGSHELTVKSMTRWAEWIRLHIVHATCFWKFRDKRMCVNVNVFRPLAVSTEQ